MEYDIQEVRRAARQVGNAARALSDISNGDLAKIKADIPGNLRGEAADALSEVMTDLLSDTRKLTSGLEQISRELDAFAERLKKADEAAKKAFESR